MTRSEFTLLSGRIYPFRSRRSTLVMLLWS